MDADTTIVLTLECENRIGIVHSISGFLAERGYDIIDSQQFDDKLSNRFYMRVEAETGPGRSGDLDRLRAEFAPIAAEFEMTWHLSLAGTRVRTLIMVSRADHCLIDLLSLWEKGDLDIDIVAIVSNHSSLKHLADRADLPFIHIPVSADTKIAAEARLIDLISDLDVELVVLARYMQVLSDDLCSRLPGQVINIHHSFLPGFKGARPYHQAHARGVKMVGATAHYATADLDEGPIIVQTVFPVTHKSTPRDLQNAGRRAERDALTQAVELHTENRVFINGHRTIIFP